MGSGQSSPVQSTSWGALFLYPHTASRLSATDYNVFLIFVSCVSNRRAAAGFALIARHNAATTRQQGLSSLPPAKSALRCDAARGSLLELPAGPPDMRDPGAQIQTVGDCSNAQFSASD